ncbi:MAG: DMT family transporter [Myxococcota bacterium]|jgi:drug/metabolite transporter (DMT)-like permease
MNARTLKSSLILLLVAVIWGSTFVAQRVAMGSIGPLFYTAVRFALGGLLLLPFALVALRKEQFKKRDLVAGVAAAGLALFGGASLQQMGMVETPAGKAGFITGLYVVLVPLILLFWRKRPSTGELCGAALSIAGLYFLSVHGRISLEPGDAWVIASAFVWAVHLLVLGHFSPRLPTFIFASGQFIVCAVLSMAAALVFEPVRVSMVGSSAVPIIYGGAVSVCIAYTLQIFAQRELPPTFTAIILSLETVFAAVFGAVILGERMGGRELVGASLMFAGMMAAQLAPRRRITL